ncbi:MAG: glycosyltransferase family 2 protein [Sedimentisphaerales bacterium]|nr:glycosyltransferase family 2 protein [Sedimentisphaerales bacterium]
MMVYRLRVVLTWDGILLHYEAMTTCEASSDRKVLLAIPVYNEEKSLNEVLDRVEQYIRNVLVINDGSTDSSGMILARRKDICVVSHRDNCGYGSSMIQAFQFAHGCGFDWLITMDCDLQHEPRQLPDFLRAIEADDADIISGSRYIPGVSRNGDPPPERRQINQQITRDIKDKLGLELTDAFCGFKAYRADKIHSLELTERGYAFPLEFWTQAVHHGLRVREIPVSLIYIDPDRHFGGELDDHQTRLDHYRDVFHKALKKTGRL